MCLKHLHVNFKNVFMHLFVWQDHVFVHERCLVLTLILFEE